MRYTIAVIFACLASAGDGRRLKSAVDDEKINSIEARSFASALLALQPLVGFHAGPLLGGKQANRRVESVASSPRTQPVQCLATVASKQIANAKMTKAGREAWELHKFGGASLADAELYTTVAKLLIDQAVGDGRKVPTMAIVSAMKGMTDNLVDVVTTAKDGDLEGAIEKLKGYAGQQIATIDALVGEEHGAPVKANIEKDVQDISNVLQAIVLIHSVPGTAMELVTGYGEVWSAQTLHALLSHMGHPGAWIDARDVLLVEGSTGGLGEKGSSNTMGVDPLWDATSVKLDEWWGKQGDLKALDYSKTAPIIVVTGFVASTSEGVPTTLKRSGSDYSATIFAKLLTGARITMWKNVDGVYTADPRRVPEAFPIASLKYDEAMELAYFGAQVLHPSAMTPCIEGSIPVYVRNIFNPAFPGTVITGRTLTMTQAEKEFLDVGAPIALEEGEAPIRGITSIDSVALVSLEGISSAGESGVASRLFGAFAQAGISSIMIMQASSEQSVCVAIEESQADLALQVMQNTFELELQRKAIRTMRVQKEQSIIAVVGEGLAFRKGTAATFLSALGRAGVNIRAIAQGASECQISLVVQAEDATKALRAVHSAYTLSLPTISVAVIGASGQVGTDLLKVLKEKSPRSRKIRSQFGNYFYSEQLDVNFRVAAVADSTRMVLSDSGVDLGDVTDNGLEDEVWAKSKDFNLDQLTTFMNEHELDEQKVIIDCTYSDDVANKYSEWLQQGIDVVTPNKQAGAGPLERYKACRDATLQTRSRWSYECTVGAALPVIPQLRELVESGDTIKKVEGVFSGALSYVFNTMRENPDTTFSSAVASAKEYMEMGDPRDSLNGIEVKQQMVIMAREIGMDIEAKDVEVENLVPSELRSGKAVSAAELADKLKSADDAIAARVATARDKGMCLQYVGTIDAVAGTVKAELVETPSEPPFGALKSCENVIQITSDRYSTMPLVLRGPGSGTSFTAIGVYSDFMKACRKIQSAEATW